MAQKIVLGNWKMNLNLFQAEELLNNLDTLKNTIPADIQLGLATPSVYLHSALNILSEGKIWIGAQNIYHEKSGAFTGETSAEMISSLACNFTLVGHSERRQYFGETNSQLKEKMNLALQNNLKAVFFFFFYIELRKSGDYLGFVKTQLEESLFHLKENELKNVIIAYEPIWAIGTGETASSKQAQEVHSYIRYLLLEEYGEDLSNSTSILYGGSCKPNNAEELFSQKDIDGGLIGAASIKAPDFISIAKSF